MCCCWAVVGVVLWTVQMEDYRWSEVHYSCTGHDRPTRLSLLHTSAPHISLCIKYSVTPAHSHTKDKTETAVQVDNNRDKEKGNV